MKQVLSKLNLGDINPYNLSVLIGLSSAPAIHVLDYLLCGEPISEEELLESIKRNTRGLEDIQILGVDILNNKVCYSAMMRDTAYVPKFDKKGNEISSEYYLSITEEVWSQAKKEKQRDLYATGPMIRKSLDCKIWEY